MKRLLDIIISLFLFSSSFISCKKFLQEEVYSQLAPDNFLATQEGLESTLGAAYATAANMLVNNSLYTLSLEEFPTDILTQSGDS
ncbi:MAG: hypothetical protein WKF89_17695, partial [Chitinophagaceae bacterium]